MSSTLSIAAIILAAGKSTRMRTDVCKVLHAVCGRPMLAHVLDACRGAGVRQCFGVVGYAKEQVIAAFESDREIGWVEQREQRGTGHAVLCAREQVLGQYEHVLVLCGDGPLIRADTVALLIKRHLDEQSAATLATAMLDDPTGYGRIVRDGEGRLRGILEHNDCTPAQREIREVNPSYYCFRTRELFAALDQVKPNNAKNEYYITDAISILIAAGHKAVAVTAVPPEDVFSINSRAELALVNRVMRDRTNAALMAGGVTIVDPQTTWIDPRATIGQDTVIHPFAHIGAARIGRNCSIGPFARVESDAQLADGAAVAGGGAMNEIRIFSGSSNPALAERISRYLGIPLGRAELSRFPDGEISLKLYEDVRGRDAFVVQSTCTPVNDNLLELLVYIDCLKRASAARITTVIPYFGYARQDRKDEGRVPITAKLVANLLTVAGANRVLTLDLHAAQIQGFFDIPVDHLSAEPVITAFFESLDDGQFVLVSPDVGNAKRARVYADRLGGELAIIDKRRISGSEAVSYSIIGDVKGRTVLMVDDMIATAGTVVQACNLVRDGARRIIVSATHAVLCGPAIERLSKSPIDNLAVTDTIPLTEEATRRLKNVTTLTVSELLGEAIRRIHRNESISSLFMK